MRAVVQRVTEARVTVAGEVIARIGAGLCVLLGVGRSDTETQARSLADKISRLRIFDDEVGKMNLSVVERGGAVLVVSQFTLYGDCRKGTRPSFSDAAPAAEAERLYQLFALELRARGLPIATGRFQARMEVALTNDGPVTLLVET